MSNAYEGKRHDLFDFPEVEGLEEFGLVPPVPEGFEAEATPAAAAPPVASAAPLASAAPVDASPTPEAAATPKTSAAPETPVAPETPAAPADTASDSKADGFVMEPARPNPQVPAGVTDLDEDLFQFDEIFSLEDDPYFNGTLSLDGTPTNPVFLDEPSAEDASPAALDEPAPGPAAPQSEAATASTVQEAPKASAAPVSEAPAALPTPEPKQQAAGETTLPESITPDAGSNSGSNSGSDTESETASARPVSPLMTAAPEGTIPAMPPAGGMRATLDRGPRILLPEDVPYSAAGERQRYIWALIACFLLVNTGIFVLAHQASSNFQNTMSAATGLLAEAITNQNDAPTQAAVPAFIPYVEQTTVPRMGETQAAELPIAEPWVDPSGYADPHEFAVANAKALMAEGRFEDARRQLNYVLANKARVPLKPSLREEIDYLIPQTYYEQGNATAPEEDR